MLDSQNKFNNIVLIGFSIIYINIITFVNYKIPEYIKIKICTYS